MQLSNILDKKFIGTDELRRKLSDILKNLPKDGVIIIAQHGKPKAALLDINTYLKIHQRIERRTTQTYR
ncbi:type II toxin-antitoxin system prevent-host-death family antitoxin [Candidatus Daviesbacteria bacterium]|nr:type II toxin-antitoxin system prevent-host-death family antitoxin [Candidatus Daviesbacteria bacterium]